MNNRVFRLLSACCLGVFLAAAPAAQAQASPTPHNLSFSNTTETLDANGRLVLVSRVQGDLQGVLTMALVLRADGTVTGGEWALSVSYIQFGPVAANGDASESLVQLGMIKGSIAGGSATLGSDGMAASLSGIQLNLSGGTLQYAAATTGSGAVNATGINKQEACSGSVTLTF